MCEIINHFSNDWSLLKERFNLENNKIVKIDMGLGDSHNYGKTVIKIKLSGNKSIIYKPKSLKINEQMFKLYDWFNEKGFTPRLPKYTLITKNNYGWEECIEQLPCKNEEEIKNYYKRYGALIAIMYLFKGNDMHYENIIANGEYPQVIDLETIFYNDSFFQENSNDTALGVANKMIKESVIGTGLLPHLAFQNEDGIGLEMSGLGGKEQVSPKPVLQIENANKDTMRIVRKYVKTRKSKNTVFLNEKEVDATDFTE
jgi:type 2 lantibiotic biosynthesis protein LanM